jgi:hypothetical protein
VRTPDWITEPTQTFPSPRVLSLWPEGALGVIEYRCPTHKEHVHGAALPEPERFERLRGFIFGDVTCPSCEAVRTGWIPPMHIHAIWWDVDAELPP